MRLPTTQEVLPLLHPGLQRWLRHEAGWPELSPVQRVAIPAILQGQDCIVEAPTAGGKTEAVLFPTLTRAADERRRDPSGTVRVLYLAPLRALLNNLEGRGEKYAELCGLRAFKWHGDVGQKEKVAAFLDPPDLLLTTPESMEAILLRKADWQDVFAALSIVIIDEAHNFAAGERGGHLLCLLERLAEATGRNVQRVALSATLGNPGAMLEWLAGAGRPSGVRLAVPATAPVRRDFRIHLFDEAADGEATPAHERANYRRFSTLCDLVAGDEGGGSARSLVFVGSRRSAESWAKAFGQANEALPLGRRLNVRTHHSAVSRFFREEAESLIQVASEDGLHAILSTSTLELGIDIGELRQVIQMDALASPSSFLQRVGRTGRRPGRPQLFRGLVCKVEDLLLQAATVSLGLQGRSEALLLPRRAFHLLAHQLLCLSLQTFGIAPDRAWDIFRKAHCFSGITHEQFDQLVEHMVREDYLRLVDGHLVVGEMAEKNYLHSNWRRLFAVFDSAPLYEVVHGRTPIGTLDAKFVEGLEEPFYFVLGGKLWRTEGIDPTARLVQASPSHDGHAPAWVNFGGPEVPFETAQEVGRLLCESESPKFLDEAGQRVLAGLQRGCVGDGWRPGRIDWRVSASGTGYLTTYAGDRINRTLARLLELAGAGKATASYAQIEVKKQPPDSSSMRDSIERVLTDLRTGRWRDPGALARVLEGNQRLWPFSPFARCLPEPLWAAALVEQTLDPAGLVALA